MAAITPHWPQPSHPALQEVIYLPGGFLTKSYSKIHQPPFGVFATLPFPPCTRAEQPTYATVQMGRDAHLHLNSDLLYINHGCDPSLIFDMATLTILAGPKGLRPGTELTFFYPSTEWKMAQGFDCICGAASCRGRISGAADMSAKQLEGVWLNGFIRKMLEERDAGLLGTGKEEVVGWVKDQANGNGAATGDGRGGLTSIIGTEFENGNGVRLENGSYKGHGMEDESGKQNGNAGFVPASANGLKGQHEGAGRVGPTSRELSGEMGGDTTSA